MIDLDRLSYSLLHYGKSRTEISFDKLDQPPPLTRGGLGWGHLSHLKNG